MSPARTPRKAAPVIASMEELLAYALTVETEAAERYAELADQMAVHNNQEVAELFMKLGSMERLHADHIRKKAQGYVLPKVSPWEYQWGGTESPEALGLDEIHYLIKPYQAMKLALCHEQQMAEFYGKVVRTSKNKEVRQFAQEYEKEEKEHVRLLTEWLERCPEPAPDWDDDPDPPVEQE